MAILHVHVVREKTVMTQRLTLSNVPAAEESAFASTPNLEDDNASTNVSIDDNDSDEFAEGVSD